MAYHFPFVLRLVTYINAVRVPTSLRPTTFIINILKELDYDIIKYDAGDIRNKTIIDTITKHNMADRNVLSMY